MQDNLQIAAFIGGTLDRLAGREEGREVALGLPLSRLIAKMEVVPKDVDPIEHLTPILQKLSPFPDEPLTVSFETVRESAAGAVVIAAALPESASDDIAEALDAAKLNVTRIDMLVLGVLRGLWKEFPETDGRRLVIVRDVDCLSIVAMDNDGPSAIRAITNTVELKREVMLSLLEAEDFGGSRKLAEIVIVEPEGMVSGTEDGDPFGCLADFAPVRRIQIGSQAALVGIADRSEDEGSLNALPESWHEVLEESRFKRKLIKYLAVAGGIWLLIMGVFFGVPIAYGFMTDYQKGLSKQHARQYKAVKEMKAKVDLIHKYSDHARGALEIMKALSDRLPEGVTLDSWNFKREDGVRVSGDAETSEAVYTFKDEMAELTDGDGEPIFGTVNLSGPNARRNMYHFDLDCQYKKEGEE